MLMVKNQLAMVSNGWNWLLINDLQPVLTIISNDKTNVWEPISNGN